MKHRASSETDVDRKTRKRVMKRTGRLGRRCPRMLFLGVQCSAVVHCPSRALYHSKRPPSTMFACWTGDRVAWKGRIRGTRTGQGGRPKTKGNAVLGLRAFVGFVWRLGSEGVSAAAENGTESDNGARAVL